MAPSTYLPSPRGQPRSFDIERAVNIFWSSGYHATSLLDRLEATSLSRGSLYAAFGDKHGLVLCALDCSIEHAPARLDIELNSPGNVLARTQVRIDGYVARTDGVNNKRDCLVVATAMELSAHTPEINARIAQLLHLLEAKLTASLARTTDCRTAGRFPPCAYRMHARLPGGEYGGRRHSLDGSRHDTGDGRNAFSRLVR